MPRDKVRPSTSTEGAPLSQLEPSATVTLTIVFVPTEDATAAVWFEIISCDLTGFVAGQCLTPLRKQLAKGKSKPVEFDGFALSLLSFHRGADVYPEDER